jgi:hypothetical protein
VLRTGPIGVFPAARPDDDLCRRLGLSSFAAPTSGVAPPTPADPLVAMRDTVVAALRRSCVNGADAQALVRQALDRAGLRDWTVSVTTPFTPDRPCASPGFDEPGRRVLIVPIPTSG